MALGLAMGACDYDVFACNDDDECLDGARAGVCQHNGWCSFSDGDCRSGQRYGAHAPDDVAHACVPTPDEESMGSSTTDPGEPNTVTGYSTSDGTTEDEPDESSSSGDPRPQSLAECPDDAGLELCMNFESFAGLTVFDDHDSSIAGVLIPPAEIADGIMGNTLTLWGYGGRLVLGSQVHPTGTFSVEARFQIHERTHEWTLVDQWSHGEGLWLGGSPDGERLTFWINDMTISTPVLPLDEWIRVTATYDADSGQMRLYLDGQQVDAGLHAEPLIPVQSFMMLGSGESGSHMYGQIDGVHLWDRVLVPVES